MLIWLSSLLIPNSMPSRRENSASGKGISTPLTIWKDTLADPPSAYVVDHMSGDIQTMYKIEITGQMRG